MKVKLFHLLYMTAFLAICLLPFVGMLVFGPSQPGANEIPAPRPRLLESDGSLNWEVLDETEDYIADRFALRQELVSLWALLNSSLLDTSVNDQVILGQEGWLYYGSTADDYMGVTMSREALTYGARNLSLMQEYAQSMGARFLFTIAPNKNSLYPGFMPEDYPRGETSNAQQLTELLGEMKVNYADLFTVFRQEEEVLYYRTDSHWTARGAALAADTILQQLHRSTGYYEAGFTAQPGHIGDLYQMLYPAGMLTEQTQTYEKGFTFAYLSEPNGGNAITITTQQPNARDSLVCWRDSFGIALHPYLAEVYETAMFSRSVEYDMTEIGRRGADAVLVELVERNLGQLTQTAPILAAPRRNVTPEAYGAETLTGAVGRTVEQLHQVTVNVPDALADSGSPVYVKIGDIVYECCVICDGEDLIASAYLKQEVPKVVDLMVRTQGALTTYSCVIEP